MKNPNKFGTCYKLSGKRRRPYIAKAYTGKDDDGKPIYQILGYYRTKSEGIAALIEYKNNPYEINQKDLSFKDVYKLWFDYYKSIKGELKVFNNYQKAFNLLKPIHNELFINLKSFHYQRLLNQLGEKYKKSYLEYVYILIKRIYKFAVSNDICVKDYSISIINTGIQMEEQSYFTELDLIKTYKNINKVKNADMILTLCLTGIRPGELFNITKFNVDFNNNIISGIGIKTNAGLNKEIPISKFLKPILINRYNKADTFLFAKPNGLKMDYQYFLNHIYKPCLKELNIPYKSPKSTRHFLATFTNEVNVNKKARTGILGHTNVEFTDRTYTHNQKDFLNKEYNKVDNKLERLFSK